MWSSRAGFELEDTSRTNFGGLGHGLEVVLPWHQRSLTLPLAWSLGLKEICCTHFSSLLLRSGSKLYKNWWLGSSCCSVLYVVRYVNGMGTSRTNFGGLGLGLAVAWPWPWPWTRRCCFWTHPWHCLVFVFTLPWQHTQQVNHGSLSSTW